MYTSPLLKEAFSIEGALTDQELLSQVRELLNDAEDRLQLLFMEERHRILSIETIEKICVRYRLRFLDIEFFKGEIPSEVYNEIEKLENKYRTRFRRLRVIAPGEFFELEHIDKDPILLAELAPDKFLFIHKWGGEFNFWRKVKAFPLRSIGTGILSIASLAVLLATLLAGAVAGFNVSALDFAFSVFHLTLGGVLFTVFVALSFSVYPTKMTWRRKFLDF